MQYSPCFSNGFRITVRLLQSVSPGDSDITGTRLSPQGNLPRGIFFLPFPNSFQRIPKPVAPGSRCEPRAPVRLVGLLYRRKACFPNVFNDFRITVRRPLPRPACAPTVYCVSTGFSNGLRHFYCMRWRACISLAICCTLLVLPQPS